MQAEAERRSGERATAELRTELEAVKARLAAKDDAMEAD